MSEKYIDSEGKVICQECGQSYNLIAHAHMKKHGMTVPEYKEKYPDAPVSSERFKVSQKFRTHDVFKENEINDIKESIEKEKVEPTIQVIENNLVVEKKIKSSRTSMDVKIEIVVYLQKFYPSLINNYVIEKKALNGQLVYAFMTDMTDIVTRTIFNFPNCIWHNKEIRPNAHKFETLKKDGWKVITFEEKIPSIESVKDELELLEG